MAQGKTSSRHVLIGQGLSFFVGLLVHCVARYAQLAYPFIHSTQSCGSKAKRSIKYGVEEVISLVLFWLVVIVRTSVLVGLTVVLAPVYATLTASISPDTTVACICGLLLLHLYLHDYRKSNNPDIKPTFQGSLGLACGMCASVLMSTRMQALLDVIAIVRVFNSLAQNFADLVTVTLICFCADVALTSNIHPCSILPV